MILILNNGKKFIPRGTIKFDQPGIRIESLENTITIPYSQIAWIYEGKDFTDEYKVFNRINTVNKRFKINASYEELMGELYT